MRSFVGETLVLMADGSKKPIDKLKIGDEVVATDPETGEQVHRKITRVWVHDDTLTELVLADGTVLTTTEDHLFWSVDDQEFERTDHLAKGERVLTADGRTVAVVGLVGSTAHTGLAYNLSIEGVHTYHVGPDEILVHNDCDPFDAVDSLRGADPEDVLNIIPDNWTVKSLKKGEGIRFLNPKKPGQAIIYEEGWAGHADPLHRGPYLRVSNGKDPAYRIPLAGNPALP